MIFWSIFYWFLLDVGPLEPLVSTNSPREIVVFDILLNTDLPSNFIDFECQHDLQNPPKTLPKSTRNRSKTTSKLWYIFWSIFLRFWTRFGPQVGAMLELCWPQTLQKTTSKTTPKKHLKNSRGLLRVRAGAGLLWALRSTENNPHPTLQEQKTRPYS